MRMIDADALMVVLEKVPAVGFKNIDNQTYTLVLLAQVLNIIKQQSTIERKTGKWLFPYGDKKYKRCSVCERDYYSIPHNSNFCPNCGADMRGEGHEN